MSTIPASAIVAVNPGVISAGGSALNLSGLVLTNGTRVPIGQVLSFPSAVAVNDYFGPTSKEASAAAVYFSGFDNSNVKPGAILFSQYNQAAVPAFLRGGDISSVPLSTLDVLTGTMDIVVNGTIHTSSTVTLTSLGSLSLIAAAIQSAFSGFSGSVTYDSVSGGLLFTTTATGATETISNITSTTGTAATCTSTGTVLTINGTLTGTRHIGDYVSGTDSTNSLPAGTTIINQLTGSAGGSGTYTISAAAAPGDLGSCVVTSSGPLGSLAVGLGLTQASGAVLSQGADVAVPATNMAAIVAKTMNWATFMTTFNPDNSGNAVKLAFANWNATQNNRFAYVCWDTDITPTQSTSATGSLGYLLKQSQTSGTILIYEPSDLQLAPFICGSIASLDFTETNGRATLAFKSQSGLSPSVTNQTAADNLIANGYNFYGAYATANDQFTFLYPGSVSGEFKWADSYANQIWLNNAFQLALMTLLTNVKSIPYNSAGYTTIRAACSDPIQQGLNFGAFSKGVPLSIAQAAEVNNAAGTRIDNILSTQGYYLQILPAIASVRAARKSPPMTFYYMDGGSVQQIKLASIEVQ